MKLNILLGIAAIYMGLVGLGLIFAPQAFGVGAVPADPSPALIAYLRLWGSPLLGIAVLNWKTSNAEPSAARDAVILGNTVGFAAIAALDVWARRGRAAPDKGVRRHPPVIRSCVYLGRTTKYYHAPWLALSHRSTAGTCCS